MLLITHDLSGARYMADRVALMYTGHIVEIGSADRVIDAPQMPYTQLRRSVAPPRGKPPRRDGRGAR